MFIFTMYLMKEVCSHGEQLDSSDYKLMVRTWRLSKVWWFVLPAPRYILFTANGRPCQRDLKEYVGGVQ